jgi:hypothetical protein
MRVNGMVLINCGPAKHLFGDLADDAQVLSDNYVYSREAWAADFYNPRHVPAIIYEVEICTNYLGQPEIRLFDPAYDPDWPLFQWLTDYKGAVVFIDYRE